MMRFSLLPILFNCFISLGQNIGFVDSDEVIANLKSFERALNELTIWVNKSQDSLERMAIPLERTCFHCSFSNESKEELEKSNRELIAMEQKFVTDFDHMKETLLDQVQSEFLFFLECFAIDNNIAFFCHVDIVLAIPVRCDYTDELIQYILCFYESQ